MLIKSYDERLACHEQRHREVLTFLRDETWTSSLILMRHLGCSAASVSKTMKQLELKGFVVRHAVPELSKTLWGITPHGLAFSWAEDEPMQQRPHFEPSKLSALAVPHHLDIQMARIGAVEAGWSGWVSGHRLPAGLAKRPDAVTVDPDGACIAIELERHVKTLKRYEAIFATYLQSIKRGEYAAVHYVCPDEGLAKRLTRVFGLVQAVPLLGERVPITDKHRAKFPVYALDRWPPSEI